MKTKQKLVTKQELLTKMQELKACKDAVGWVTTLNTDLASEAWDRCQRGDWLLWLAGELNADRKLLVSGACACARTSLTYINDPQALEIATNTLNVAEKWTKGTATDEEMKIASDAAYTASAYAAAAAAAATYAAYAYDAAYNASYAAVSAASYAAYASASYDTARMDSLASSAKIVKSIIKWEDLNF